MNPPIFVPLGRRLALVALMFLITGTMGFLQTFAPLYLTAAGLNKINVGIVNAVGTGLALLIQPILGRLSDRFDTRRPFLFFAAVVAGIAYLNYRSVSGIVAFTLLTALGVNSFQYLNAAPGVLIARISQNGVSKKGGGAAYVGYRVWGSVGYIVVAMGMGLLVNRALPPGTQIHRADLDPIFTYGPLLYLGIALLALFVPDPKAAPIPTAETESNDADAENSNKSRRARTSNLNRFLVAYFLYCFALYGSSTFLSIYMRQLGAQPLQITTMFAGGVVSEVVVMLFAGRWSDRHGRRPALAFALLSMPIRLLLYMPARSPEWVTVVQLMHGLNFGIVGAIAPVFVNDLSDDANRGGSQARLAASGGLALSLGPILCGYLADRFGIPTMFGAMSAVGAIGVIWFLATVKESHPFA